MAHWRYANGKDYQPTDAYVRKHRSAEAMQ